MIDVQSVVNLIDHAVLQPMQTDDDVRTACVFCRKLAVASVCVKPSHVELAAELLAGSPVLVSTVIGFPHGGTSTAAKVVETELACRAGAGEVDMVINIGKALLGDWKFVAYDIQAVVDAARNGNAITKIIFETGLLPNDSTKIRLCEISEAAGAAFVKTSTGFGYVRDGHGQLIATGATEHDIHLMRNHCGPAIQVKASGGIRNYSDAAKFVKLGATRLGTSSTQTIAAAEPAGECIPTTRDGY